MHLDFWRRVLFKDLNGRRIGSHPWNGSSKTLFYAVQHKFILMIEEWVVQARLILLILRVLSEVEFLVFSFPTRFSALEADVWVIFLLGHSVPRNLTSHPNSVSTGYRVSVRLIFVFHASGFPVMMVFFTA